ncbi:MAG: RecQ family ATP-dependent DNA helicase, partial [Gammaproteobacteria bacterium]|nr:RecQ family ATP-dependent DNA helicase [Gammaproteobacteria bacterium]
MTGQERKHSRFLTGGLSLDLEVGKQNGRINRFAAVRADSGRAFTSGRGDLKGDLARLDQLAAGADYLVGHNLVAFDVPHLQAAASDLALLRLPCVDTLRLNPLAFPRNPYHHLVKHYHDGGLKKVQLNDPKLDSLLTLELLQDQYAAFSALHSTDPDLLLAWHWLTTRDDLVGGLQALFTEIRDAPRPSREQAVEAIRRRFANDMCATHSHELLQRTAADNWALAYALAWLSVAGGDSAMPPWVRFQFPEASRIVTLLRDLACTQPECRWCRTRHDARAELTRWFGFEDFRPTPVDARGRPLQQVIVEAAMAGQHVFGILPTGTGKSLCYQIPALSRYDKTGALTVVISPLVALMADQVAGLERQGVSNCAAFNGLLSMPERSDVLDRVRLGELAILIISPEQLRSRALRRVLEQRQIGGWVLDEAHCLSKWGHDFRPDYRYIGRYIQERAGADPVPPILCLTATAKPEVIEDIAAHFRERLDIELQTYDGGSSRTNLDFAVVQTAIAEKFAQVHQVIDTELPETADGGAIIYCATRRTTEEMAAFLQAKGLAAEHFHAGLSPEVKKYVQSRFIDGELRVIVATNAFGMGIDKPDVRLVIHADIPGSLENYLQEAGRAGRDGQPARCVLLFAPEDVERQFGMSARSRLKVREISAILRALRRLDKKKRQGGEVIVTSGEILLEEEQGSFTRDSTSDDTRVRTALAWLEEAKLLQRDENEVCIFPSSLRVASLEDAEKILLHRKVTEPVMTHLLSIVRKLLQADPDEGVSTDELMGVTGLDATGVRKALHDLEALGLASNDTALTAFVHAGIERSSTKRLETAIALERAMIEKLQELAPDMAVGDTS